MTLSKRARNHASTQDRKRTARVRKLAAGSGVAALSLSAVGTVVSPAVAVAEPKCIAVSKTHSGNVASDGAHNYGFGTNSVKVATDCRDTNVSYASQPGYMRGLYVDGAGVLRWGNATVYVQAGQQSPWKVIISNLSAGRTFNHGHSAQLFAKSTWRY